MTFERWLDEVVRALIECGLSQLDAGEAVMQHEDWFKGGYESGSVASLTAQEWYEHYYG